VAGCGGPATATAPGTGALVEFTVELDDPARDGDLSEVYGPAGAVEPDHVVEVRIILPDPG
jgi:hypothetical protein